MTKRVSGAAGWLAATDSVMISSAGRVVMGQPILYHLKGEFTEKPRPGKRRGFPLAHG